MHSLLNFMTIFVDQSPCTDSTMVVYEACEIAVLTKLGVNAIHALEIIDACT